MKKPEALPDPLRAENLRGPFYSTTITPHLSMPGSSTSFSRADLLDMERERYAEVIALRSLLNSSITINQLPNELLAEILLHVRSGDLSTLRWLNLLLVCRHWFYVIATTPSFWSFLPFYNNANLLRTGLARSKGTSVDVSCSHTFGDDAFLSETFALIQPHTTRLRSLKFECHSPEAALRLHNFFGSHSMPRLQKLKLRLLSRAQPMQPPLPLQQFPDLQQVDLVGFYIPPSPSFLQQLRVVDYTENFMRTGSDVAALVNMVRNLVNVEELRLARAASRASANVAIVDVASPAEGRVTLHNLRSLRMIMETPIIRQLLSNIVVPPTSRVMLTANYPRDHPDLPSILQMLPHDKTICLPVLSQLVSATVKIYYDLRGLEVTGLTSLLSDDGFGPQNLDFICSAVSMDTSQVRTAVDVMDALRAMEDAVKLQALTIKCHTISVFGAAWQACFHAHPMLCDLTLRIRLDELDMNSAEHVMQQLDPDDGDEQITSGDTVPGPNLMFLRLRGPWRITENLLAITKECLENRRRRLGRQQALTELSMEVCGFLGMDTFMREKKAFEEELSHLVGSVRLHLQPDST
ncbi:hypothetical protein PYCCODRAFT_454109 [Trametes coccinea BRFM310]|uniref:F-box domain-containing protein n=1 Tax=Trametes coccinea (strain BRFM310) TaxID=1353009 RepID=A0A1Y2IL63_TRAC3|nr:hypothetical protein PYCCODRAFT_454109 [Trametes coccinea BRFM310]